MRRHVSALLPRLLLVAVCGCSSPGVSTFSKAGWVRDGAEADKHTTGRVGGRAWSDWGTPPAKADDRRSVVAPLDSGELGPWPAFSAPSGAVPNSSYDSALVVAVEHYLFVPEVPGAVANAADWYQWFAKVRRIPHKRLRLLVDRQVTVEKVMSAAQGLAKARHKKGRTWFVFIGHGAPSKDQREGVLVGVDAQQDVMGLYARSVSLKDVLDALSRRTGTPPIAVVDACFSGRSGTGAPLVQGVQPLVVVTPSAGNARSTI